MTTLLAHISHPILVLVTLLAITYALSYARWRARTHGRHLPPGPRGLPYIGNVRYMNKPEPWKANRELCQKYGDVVNVPVMGQNMIFLGSAQAIQDLLEKRSAVTSGRFPSIFALLAGHEHSFALMGYTAQWRVYRKTFSRHFGAVVNPYHLKAQREASLMFLRKLVLEPERLPDHIRYTSTAAVLKATYGVALAVEKDKNITLMHKIAEGTEAASAQNQAVSFIIQLVPALTRLPLWAPVIGPLLQRSSSARDAVVEAQTTLRSGTRKIMEAGDSRSVLSKLLEDVDTREKGMQLEAQQIADAVALVAFEGASESTSSTMQFFFAAMALFPDVQQKAQAELDVKVGRDRLPNHSDKASLPYANALMKELLRWSAVIPFAFPHFSTEDMEYKGYFIPKGSGLVAQSWSCLNDPEIYPEPEQFMPERFLHEDGQVGPTTRDPKDFIFGYGRRVCPGKDFGEAGLFINIVMVLHVLNIRMPHDECGKPLYTEAKSKGSIVLYPEDCRCTIEARSEKMLELLKASM